MFSKKHFERPILSNRDPPILHEEVRRYFISQQCRMPLLLFRAPSRDCPARETDAGRNEQEGPAA
jgi:hypothetical protein